MPGLSTITLLFFPLHNVFFQGDYVWPTLREKEEELFSTSQSKEHLNILLELFCMEDSSLFIHLHIYSITYLYQYGLVDTYCIL